VEVVVAAEETPVEKVLFLDLVEILELWEDADLLFDNPESVDLLNRSAPAFFFRVEKAFVHELVLGIARLLDPEGTGDRRNASLRALLGDPRLQELPGVLSELSTAISEAEEKAKPLTRFRHKRVGHRDLMVAVGFEELPNFELSLIREVIFQLRKVHFTYGKRVLGTHFDYDGLQVQGAGDLLEILKGVPSNEERIQRLLEEERRDLERGRDGSPPGEVDSPPS